MSVRYGNSGRAFWFKRLWIFFVVCSERDGTEQAGNYVTLFFRERKYSLRIALYNGYIS